MIMWAIKLRLALTHSVQLLSDDIMQYPERVLSLNYLQLIKNKNIFTIKYIASLFWRINLYSKYPKITNLNNIWYAFFEMYFYRRENSHTNFLWSYKFQVVNYAKRIVYIIHRHHQCNLHFLDPGRKIYEVLRICKLAN